MGPYRRKADAYPVPWPRAKNTNHMRRAGRKSIVAQNTIFGSKIVLISYFCDLTFRCEVHNLGATALRGPQRTVLARWGRGPDLETREPPTRRDEFMRSVTGCRDLRSRTYAQVPRQNA